MLMLDIFSKKTGIKLIKGEIPVFQEKKQDHSCENCDCDGIGCTIDTDQIAMVGKREEDFFLILKGKKSLKIHQVTDGEGPNLAALMKKGWLEEVLIEDHKIYVLTKSGDALTSIHI